MKRKNTDDASKLEFMKNLIGMRQVSIKNGNSQMSLEEINAEIKAARKSRKGKSV